MVNSYEFRKQNLPPITQKKHKNRKNLVENLKVNTNPLEKQKKPWNVNTSFHYNQPSPIKEMRPEGKN